MVLVVIGRSGGSRRCGSVASICGRGTGSAHAFLRLEETRLIGRTTELEREGRAGGAETEADNVAGEVA